MKVPLLVYLVFFFVFRSIQVIGEPHPHSGKVTPFQAGDPGVKLSGDALKILKSGHPYKTQIQSGTAGRGMVVQDVHAPTHIVWGRILDFPAYPNMVPKTIESQIYRTEKLRHGVERIWVRMKIGFPVLKLQFFINHLYDPSKNSMTWTLDYENHKSDLDDSVGYWYVIPHPDNPQHHSRVYYSVEVSMFSWVPQFVVDFMSKQALVDATAWVKKYSELEASKLGLSSPPSALGKSKASTTINNKRKKWWGKPKIKNQSPAAASLPSSVSSTEEKSSMQTNEDQRRMGLKRYALVSTVLALSFYNVHLYFSQ